MSAVSVYSYTHSVTYVTDNILKSLKDVIRLSGLNPAKLAREWDSIHLAIKTWIQSGHLERVTLEIFNPATDKLALRWDLDIVYQWSGGDGSF